MYLANNWVSVRSIYFTSVRICITIVILTPIYLRVQFFKHTKYSQIQYSDKCTHVYCVFVILKQKNLMWDKNRAFLETLQDRKEGSGLSHWAQQGRRLPCRRRPFTENIAKKSALRATRSPRMPLAIQPRTNGHRNRCSRGCSRGAGSRLPAHPALQKSVKQYLFNYSFCI
jgi:hypothetical protein